MPYIKRDNRVLLDKTIKELGTKINLMTCDGTNKAGLLNYVITNLMLQTMSGKRYWMIALVTGVLKNVSDEFYRRYAVPYEDEQIKKNGDVYPKGE